MPKRAVSGRGRIPWVPTDAAAPLFLQICAPRPPKPPTQPTLCLAPQTHLSIAQTDDGRTEQNPETIHPPCPLRRCQIPRTGTANSRFRASVRPRPSYPSPPCLPFHRIHPPGPCNTHSFQTNLKLTSNSAQYRANTCHDVLCCANTCHAILTHAQTLHIIPHHAPCTAAEICAVLLLSASPLLPMSPGFSPTKACPSNTLRVANNKTKSTHNTTQHNTTPSRATPPPIYHHSTTAKSERTSFLCLLACPFPCHFRQQPTASFNATQTQTQTQTSEQSHARKIARKYPARKSTRAKHKNVQPKLTRAKIKNTQREKSHARN